ncbi:hypothetical protein [Microbacterium rhizosphaerae]|uniref:Uncharacterized protein n=1 Tax=Microbacterium rhizosphaerae TaxID=1678237 RepID=A0ABZ0SPU5_9MICO|nr:hypothetical protein [Microbacterium rhizosphaerae]WPR91349.1 hypothetical protein SM116_08755 [Microbacterium rhizosphaerae]
MDMREFDVPLDKTTRLRLRSGLLGLAGAAESMVKRGVRVKTYDTSVGRLDVSFVADQSLLLSLLSAADHLRALGKLIVEPRVTVTLSSASRGAIESLARGHWIASGVDGTDVSARALTLLRRDAVASRTANSLPTYQDPGSAAELSADKYLALLDSALEAVGGVIRDAPRATDLSTRLLEAAFPNMPGRQKYAELSAIAHGGGATVGLYATGVGTLRLPQLAALNVIGPAIGCADEGVPTIAAAPVSLFRNDAIREIWQPAVRRIAPLVDDLRGRDLPGQPPPLRSQ